MSRQKLETRQQQPQQPEEPSDSKKLLILPKSADETVISTLKLAKVAAREYGVRNALTFERSGAALITVAKDESKAFVKRIEEVGLKLKGVPVTQNSRFTLHDIPGDMSVEEVSAYFGLHWVHANKRDTGPLQKQN